MTLPQKQQTKPIIEKLDQIHQQTGYRWPHIFREWIRIVFVSLQHDDETHGEIVGNYKSDFDEEIGQAAIEAYSEAFAELLRAMERTEADLLGYLYQEYGATSDRSGQFFTPPNAAKFAASMMTLGTEITDSIPDDPIRISDPTCGSGTLLIAAGQRLEEMAKSSYSAMFYGQDIDSTCVEMTAINFTIRGLPGCVIHGDSLKMQPTTAWKILPSKGLMRRPIQECEPPTFTFRRTDTTSTETSTSTTGDEITNEKDAEIDVEMTQQSQFSTFVNDEDNNR